MITNFLRFLFTRSFKPFIFTNEHNYELDLDVPELGIYVHIPFCTTICSFCPYNKVKYNKSLAASYKDALIKEINMLGALNKKMNKITSVYFGGGSPALMLEELSDILAALRNNFNIKSNIGIELHPRDINEETLLKLKSIGFDMVSIGIQSFQEKGLKVLGRDYINGAEKVKIATQVSTYPFIDFSYANNKSKPLGKKDKKKAS